jgi:hypothetical protein
LIVDVLITIAVKNKCSLRHCSDDGLKPHSVKMSLSLLDTVNPFDQAIRASLNSNTDAVMVW